MNLSKLFPATTERSVQQTGNYHQNFSGWLGGILGYGTSKAGTEVTLQTAQAHTAVMSCYTILAESMANMPLSLMKKEIKKGVRYKSKAYEHRLYDVLNLKPNYEMTQFEWIEAMMMNVVSRGNAYSQVLRNKKGEIVGFYPLLTDNMTIVRTKDGRLGYKYYSSYLAEYFWLDKKDVLHIKYKTMDGIVGLSPIAYSRHSIGLSIALEEHGSNHFRQGINSTGVFELPTTLSQEAFDRLRTQLLARYEGLRNSGKPMVLENGLEWKQIAIPNNDSQYLESRTFQKSEIASIFRIPPHMINILDHATFSNIEHQGIYFATNTIQSWVKRFEQPLTLLLRKEAPNLYASFNMDAIKRGDIESRYNAYGNGIRDGWLTRNEVRISENKNPIDGLDEPILPLNMGGDNGK